MSHWLWPYPLHVCTWPGLYQPLSNAILVMDHHKISLGTQSKGFFFQVNQLKLVGSVFDQVMFPQLTWNEDCVYPASLSYKMHFFDIHTSSDKYVSLVHLQNMPSVVRQKPPLQCLVVPCSFEFLLHWCAVDKTDMYFVTGCNYKIDLWFITSST